MTAAPSLLRVCITGPESTGKTTLAMHLARHLVTAWSPEASRLYAQEQDRPLTAADVEPIAGAQLAACDEATRDARRMGAAAVVFDTDLLSTVVYARHYYGAVPPDVVREALARRADLYLLCDVDVPWVADGVRDRPDDREEMLQRFRDTLREAGADPVLVRGGWTEREALATRTVDRRLALTRSAPIP